MLPETKGTRCPETIVDAVLELRTAKTSALPTQIAVFLTSVVGVGLSVIVGNIVAEVVQSRAAGTYADQSLLVLSLSLCDTSIVWSRYWGWDRAQCGRAGLARRLLQVVRSEENLATVAPRQGQQLLLLMRARVSFCEWKCAPAFIDCCNPGSRFRHVQGPAHMQACETLTA